MPPAQSKQCLAHVRQKEDGSFVEHALEEHLSEVAKGAAKFAETFGSSDWGFLAGLWHDLGKYSAEFQRRIKAVSGYDAEAHLEGQPGRVDHSTAGAQHAIVQFGLHGRILAYLIAGHHAGLPDWHAGEAKGGALALVVAPTLRGGRGLKLRDLEQIERRLVVAPTLRGGRGWFLASAGMNRHECGAANI